jgi:superfamily II DNA helicase RecQ
MSHDSSNDAFAAFNQVTIPDLWQQKAVAALRDGKDVVVDAPTGSGKTLVFELWANQGKPQGKAVYTVPTRALANDKLAGAGTSASPQATFRTTSTRPSSSRHWKRRRTACCEATARACSSSTNTR